MKPRVFIGSSKESLRIARAVAAQLQDVGEITVWDEGVFQLGENSLKSLLDSLEAFDFAVLVAGADDLVTSRDVTRGAPRDNVVFELGMCMGRLGAARTLIVCPEKERPKLPSDIAGICFATYATGRSDGNDIAAVGSACTSIRKVIEDASRAAPLRLLPSTSLAIGYFNNFIKKVCMSLVDGKTATLELSPKKTVSLKYDRNNFKLWVVVPDAIGSVVEPELSALRRLSGLMPVAVEDRDRPKPLSAFVEKSAKPVKYFVDIPTTLLASREAIGLHLGRQSIGASRRGDQLEAAEVENFRKTLTNLISSEGNFQKYVELKTVAELQALTKKSSRRKK